MDRQMVTERGDLWVISTVSYTDRINLYGPYNEPYNEIGTEVVFYKMWSKFHLIHFPPLTTRFYLSLEPSILFQTKNTSEIQGFNPSIHHNLVQELIKKGLFEQRIP